MLGKPFVTVKTLQRLAGKCVSFSLVVPAAKLFTREMNAAISRGQRIKVNHSKPLTGKLRDEIEHWLFLEGWDDPLPWREERGVVIATDASNSGWGGSILAPFSNQVSDYWTEVQHHLEISTKEAIAIDKVLTSLAQQLQNTRVDVQVEHKAVVDAWNNQRGRRLELNAALKALFFTTARLNISLHLSYIPSGENPADAPSRRLSVFDNKLSEQTWDRVQEEFGGDKGHSCDLMSLDSNAMKDRMGNSLPHFTPVPSPDSVGVNLFAQDLSQHGAIMSRPYVFPLLYWLDQY